MAVVAYRDHITRSRPNAIVTYRAMHIHFALFILAMGLAMVGYGVSQSLEMVRSTEIACDRGGTNLCTVRRHYGPFKTEQPIAISRIHSIQLRTLPRKKGNMYATTLYTNDGVAIDLLRTGHQPDAEGVRAAVEQLAVGQGARAGTVGTQSGSTEPLVMLGVFAMAIIVFTLRNLRSASLAFDFERRTVAYTRYRWPLPPARRLFAAGQIERADVSQLGSKALYEVDLSIPGEDRLRLVSQTSTDRRDVAHTASQINKLLAEMREQPET
jgi:hypothetical protein